MNFFCKSLAVAFALSSIQPAQAITNDDKKKLLESCLSQAPSALATVSSKEHLKISNELLLLLKNSTAISQLPITETEKKALKDANINNISTLSSYENLHIVFDQLVLSLREKNDSSAFWTTCLYYTFSECSFNPLEIEKNHQTDFIDNFKVMLNESSITLEQGMTAQLHATLKSTELKQRLSTLNDNKSDAGKTAVDVARFLSLRPFYLAAAARRHGSYAIKNIERNLLHRDKNSLHNLRQSVIECSFETFSTLQQCLHSAQILAKKPEEKATDSVRPQDLPKTLLQNKLTSSLQSSALFDGIKNSPNSKVGMIIECPQPQGHTLLGKSAYYSSALLARGLQQQATKKQDLRLIDLHQCAEEQLPDPKEMPVLILCISKLESKTPNIKQKSLRDALSNYRYKGGKVILISNDTCGRLLPTISSELSSGNINLDDESTIKTNSSQSSPSHLGLERNNTSPLALPRNISSENQLAVLKPKNGESTTLAALIGKTGKLSGAFFSLPLILPGVLDPAVTEALPISCGKKTSDLVKFAIAELLK